MRYTIESGVRNIKSKFQKLIIGLAALAFPAALVMSSGAASAAPPSFGLQPFVFDPGNACPGITANWDSTTGNPSPSILLTKPCATEEFAASGVDIISSLEGGSVSALTELNFDYKNGEWCGAGAPRFNVQVDGNTYFLGCSGGVQTPSVNNPTTWTHVEYGPAQFAAAGIPTTGTLEDIYIIFDEGTTQFSLPLGPGLVHIDNISVNNQVVGSPTSPLSKDDCKKDGWKNLQDANGKAFKNQGDCVSYQATGGKNVAAGMQL